MAKFFLAFRWRNFRQPLLLAAALTILNWLTLYERTCILLKTFFKQYQRNRWQLGAVRHRTRKEFRRNSQSTTE